MSTIAGRKPKVHYPDSDGQPMAENTLQFEWISIIKWNLEFLFAADPKVFVAGDHLIYFEEENVKARQAPDVYVAFGPAKHDRGSYKVWEEGVFPQVLFEVWSPGNRFDSMEDKKAIYERCGAEEYYIVYPEYPAGVEGWQRVDDKFVRVPEMNGFVSPRLRVRFEAVDGVVKLFGPDGREFLSPVEMRAEQIAAERRAAESQQNAQKERDRAELLAAKLRELGVDPQAL